MQERTLQGTIGAEVEKVHNSSSIEVKFWADDTVLFTDRAAQLASLALRQPV